MKVACVNVYDTKDRGAFGGRMCRLVDALEEHSGTLHHLGPLKHRPVFMPRIVAKKVFYKFARQKHYSLRRDAALVKDYAAQLQRKMAGLDLDVIVSLISTGSQPVAYLDTKVPIVIWTDATFAATMETYPELARDRLCAETIRDGLANEAAALARSALLLYWSDWAAQSAIDTYGIDPAKVRVLPSGPSFDPGLDRERIGLLIRERPRDRCRLVFIGLEWERKGGDLVLETAKRLNASGLPTELTVIGCEPAGRGPLPPWITVTGVIDKGTPEGLARMSRLLGSSHFLFVPSRAEAMGLVFCEASAFGVPSLATRVGGIPTVVRDGRNGCKVPLDAGPDEYCGYVTAQFADYDRYLALATTAFEEYEARLNWRTITARLGEYLRETVAAARRPGSPGNTNWTSGKVTG